MTLDRLLKYGRNITLISTLAINPLGSAQDTPYRTIVVTWTAPTEGATPTGYQLAYGTSPGSHPTVINTGSTSTTYNLTNMPPGEYYLVARTVAGSQVSGDSKEAGPAHILKLNRCDINGDGIINAIDLSLLNNVIAGKITCPGDTCDVNNDGHTNSLDAVYESQAIAGKKCGP